MNEDQIRSRLGTLDRLEMPDLWPVATAREPRPPQGPSVSRRLVTVVVALTLAVASFVFAVRAFRHEEEQPASIPVITNGAIAFLGDQFTGWLVNPDGSNLRSIERPDDIAYDVPWEWSPDGTRLALYGYLTGAAGDYGIFVANADGTGLTAITANLFAGQGENNQDSPHWSPDGTLIAFGNDSDDPELVGVYVMAPDGSGVHKVGDGGNAATTWRGGPSA